MYQKDDRAFPNSSQTKPFMSLPRADPKTAMLATDAMRDETWAVCSAAATGSNTTGRFKTVVLQR